MRELDACGIGFVADAKGRPSRDIVTAALDGLANVKHRGAVAADALTSDGCGVLLPIPAAIFGEGNGVATLFLAGDDPRAAVEAALATEGFELLEWRIPPTDESHLGALAMKTKPAIVHVVFRNGDGAPETAGHPCADEIRAYRLKRLGATGNADSYSDMGRILDELAYADGVFKQHRRWPVLDVTGRSIEETAGLVLDRVFGKERAV